jgi:hypothetical protein
VKVGCRIQDARYRMQDAGCRIQDAGYRIGPRGGQSPILHPNNGSVKV